MSRRRSQAADFRIALAQGGRRKQHWQGAQGGEANQPRVIEVQMEDAQARRRTPAERAQQDAEQQPRAHAIPAPARVAYPALPARQATQAISEGCSESSPGGRMHRTSAAAPYAAGRRWPGKAPRRGIAATWGGDIAGTGQNRNEMGDGPKIKGNTDGGRPGGRQPPGELPPLPARSGWRPGPRR